MKLLPITASLAGLAAAQGDQGYHVVTGYYFNPTYDESSSYQLMYGVSYNMGVGYFYDPAYGFSNY